MGFDGVRLGEWIKALKAVVGGLKRREEHPVGTPGLQDATPSNDVRRVSQHGAVVGTVPPPGVPSASPHEFTRLARSWRWQPGFHDHKFRSRESESRKWEYVCLNPVRYRLVQRPEDWPFGGEIFHEKEGGPFLVRGTPPLLETGILIEEDGRLRGVNSESPGEGTRPTP